MECKYRWFVFNTQELLTNLNRDPFIYQTKDRRIQKYSCSLYYVCRELYLFLKYLSEDIISSDIIDTSVPVHYSVYYQNPLFTSRPYHPQSKRINNIYLPYKPNIFIYINNTTYLLFLLQKNHWF